MGWTIAMPRSPSPTVHPKSCCETRLPLPRVSAHRAWMWTALHTAAGSTFMPIGGSRCTMIPITNLNDSLKPNESDNAAFLRAVFQAEAGVWRSVTCALIPYRSLALGPRNAANLTPKVIPCDRLVVSLANVSNCVGCVWSARTLSLAASSPLVPVSRLKSPAVGSPHTSKGPLRPAPANHQEKSGGPINSSSRRTQYCLIIHIAAQTSRAGAHAIGRGVNATERDCTGLVSLYPFC
jgi:hypothetical protein